MLHWAALGSIGTIKKAPIQRIARNMFAGITAARALQMQRRIFRTLVSDFFNTALFQYFNISSTQDVLVALVLMQAKHVTTRTAGMFRWGSGLKCEQCDEHDDQAADFMTVVRDCTSQHDAYKCVW